MSSRGIDRTFERRLAGLVNSRERGVLRGGLKGVEKESLRVTPEGRLAQSPHPTSLGSALTNEIITTDYSESLIELVTPKGIIRTMATDLGVVPLGVPLIVGPAVLASLLLLTNSVGLVPTLIALVLNIALVGAMFLGAQRLMRLLGEGGAKVISKIAGLLLAAIGVMLVRRGIELFGWFHLNS